MEAVCLVLLSFGPKTPTLAPSLTVRQEKSWGNRLTAASWLWPFNNSSLRPHVIWKQNSTHENQPQKIDQASHQYIFRGQKSEQMMVFNCYLLCSFPVLTERFLHKTVFGYGRSESLTYSQWLIGGNFCCPCSHRLLLVYIGCQNEKLLHHHLYDLFGYHGICTQSHPHLTGPAVQISAHKFNT